MKTRYKIIIGIVIAAAIYLPIHYYYPFLGIGSTTQTFEDFAPEPEPDYNFDKTITVMGKESEYNLDYSMSSGTITDMQLNCDSISLVLSVSSNDSGVLTLQLQEKIIGYVEEILVDGMEWDKISLAGNTVIVSFPENIETIEIKGTYRIGTSGECSSEPHPEPEPDFNPEPEGPVTPEFFKTTYIWIVERFQDAHTQLNNGEITEDEYRYLIKTRYGQLQSLYTDVRNYDWTNEDENEYNYWFNGKLKFLNDLEAEYDRLQPFSEPEPEPPVDPAELEEFIIENFTMTLDQDRILVLLRGDHEYISVRLYSVDDDGSTSPLPRFPTNYRYDVVEDSSEKINNWFAFEHPTLPYGVDAYFYHSKGYYYIGVRNYQSTEIDPGEYYLRAIWMNRDTSDYDSIPFTVEFLKYPR